MNVSKSCGQDIRLFVAVTDSWSIAFGVLAGGHFEGRRCDIEETIGLPPDTNPVGHHQVFRLRRGAECLGQLHVFRVGDAHHG